MTGLSASREKIEGMARPEYEAMVIKADKIFMGGGSTMYVASYFGIHEAHAHRLVQTGREWRRRGFNGQTEVSQ